MSNPSPTINQDYIDFLDSLAADIEGLGDFMSPAIALRLRLLADRLTQLDALMPAISQEVQEYHCGDEDCDACNEAAANLLTGPEAT